MQDSSSVATLDLLIRIHGRTIIDISGVASEIGWSPGSIRNAISAGTFPIKSFLLGSRRMFYLADVADYIDRLRHDETDLTSLRHREKKTHRAAAGALA